ncbi:hypothetical protein V7S43_015310 [Phytophthora oleae]|uniref:PUM-HD domain-containing protein n=1 Tax=Phytophthora oleae TaxID=2107226 RepID=A0ABD3F2M9_9STRA
MTPWSMLPVQSQCDAVKWAFERQKKPWSQEMIGKILNGLAISIDTFTFIEMLSGLCNEVDAKRALGNAFLNERYSHVKAIISGRHGKIPGVSILFRHHIRDLAERKLLRSEGGLLRLGEDESSKMLLTLGEICHGRDLYLAFESSVEHSLVDCVEALIHRVSAKYAVNALRDLLRNGRLNREDLRAVLVQRSAADMAVELQMFRLLLLRGLHNDTERMARTMADRQIEGAIKATMGCTFRDEGAILTGRCESHYELLEGIDDVVVLLASKCVPDYADEVLDVALKHGLHEVTPLLADTHPSYSERLRKSPGHN